jgi:AraC-like DNA-binding protein
MKNKVSFFCFFALFLIGNVVFSQNNVKVIRDSITENLFSNPKKAKKYSYELLAMAKEKGLIKEEGIAYWYLADLCSMSSQKDSAYYYYDMGIKKAIEIKNNKLLLCCKVNKANYLFNEYNFNSALTLYNESLDIAKESNDDYFYNYILLKRGSINYEIGKYKEALKIFKEGLKKSSFETPILLGAKLNLAKTYLKLDKPDSALIYIKNGIIASKKDNLSEFEIHFLNQQGLTLIYKNQYTLAKKAFDQALVLSKKNEIIEMSRLILINTAKLYTLNKENDKAILVLKQLLENKEKVPIAAENIAEIDYLLAENYKLTNNLSLSNFHFQKYIEEEKKLGQKKVETIDHLHKIDLSEINEQKAQETKLKWIFVGIAIVSIIGILLLYYRRNKKEKENQTKFDALLQRINTYERELSENKPATPAINNAITEDTIMEEEATAELIIEEEIDDFNENALTEEEETTNHSSFVIKDEKVSEILDKLIKLEEKKYYLKQEYTLHNVAKRLKTNTAYLSKIVNSELGKNFSTYTNELRINYIIIELKNNAKLRSYSINAISEEVGYKSSESFVKYFKLATGISPTTYIKKINKLKE